MKKNLLSDISDNKHKMSYSEAYDRLNVFHIQHLKANGVKMPRFTSKLGYSLAILYKNIDNFVHIDFIKEALRANGFVLTGTDPVQVRHLSTQSGWWIEKHGKYKHRFVSATEVMPGFIAQKRASKLNDENWAEMKAEYAYLGNHCCVNCGSIEGQPMRFDLTKTTVLQQGHRDPRKDLTYDNCIPQCAFCNQSAKNKVVFDKRGGTSDFCKKGF